MSFSQSTRTSRRGETYKQVIYPKNSVNAGNLKIASEQSDAEENNVGNDRISSEVTEERTKVNLESLKEQISNVTVAPTTR